MEEDTRVIENPRFPSTITRRVTLMEQWMVSKVAAITLRLIYHSSPRDHRGLTSRLTHIFPTGWWIVIRGRPYAGHLLPVMDNPINGVPSNRRRTRGEEACVLRSYYWLCVSPCAYLKQKRKENEKERKKGGKEEKIARKPRKGR